MNVKRITPVLLVNEIEPLLPFWMDRLGFARTIEVPDGDKLGFVAFQKGSAEVMYQTYASVEKDAPADMAALALRGPTYLYVEVDDLNAVLATMKDLKKVMPERTAFYGMREFAVRDPQGHFITFAQPAAAQAIDLSHIKGELHMNTSPLKNSNHIFRVDKFKIPAAAKEDFLARARASHDFLRTIPGFIEDFLLQETLASGDLKVVTIAIWENAQAFDSAKCVVQQRQTKMGYNPAETLERLGIEADMGAYTELKS